MKTIYSSNSSLPIKSLCCFCSLGMFIHLLGVLTCSLFGVGNSTAARAVIMRRGNAGALQPSRTTFSRSQAKFMAQKALVPILAGLCLPTGWRALDAGREIAVRPSIAENSTANINHHDIAIWL